MKSSQHELARAGKVIVGKILLAERGPGPHNTSLAEYADVNTSLAEYADMNTSLAEYADVKEFEPPLDPGIAAAVHVLRAGGIETFESCDGGRGHAYPEPTVRFHGERAAGFEALAVAMYAGLAVSELRRIWPVIDGEPTGPSWEMTFYPENASGETDAVQDDQDQGREGSADAGEVG